MMGDALSHTVLPGVVIAFIVAFQLRSAGWISNATYDASRHSFMFFGAMVLGILSAVLTEWVQRLGRVEASAALGVVFTTLFAIGLLLVRLFVDKIHIDPDCVLYGTIETVVMDTCNGTSIPRAAVVSGAVLLANLALLLLFFKELQIVAFDPALATTLGIAARPVHYALMAVTAATLVSAFESVGSILVIAMLIAPAAAAYLLTDRLSVMIGLSLLIAGLAAFLGHAMAIVVPPVVFSRLGYDTVVDASTAGMMAAACGLLFFAAMLFGPRHGLISKTVHRSALSLKIASEDLLGMLYRIEESQGSNAAIVRKRFMNDVPGMSKMLTWLALFRLTRTGQVLMQAGNYQLTQSGRDSAQKIVRSHRLFESYMAKHFDLPDDHLHQTASKVEHFIGPRLRLELEGELEQPETDPHGKAIPPEKQEE